MNRTVILAAIAFAAVATHAAAAEPNRLSGTRPGDWIIISEDTIPNQYIFVLEEGSRNLSSADAEGRVAVARDLTRANGCRLERVYLSAINAFAAWCPSAREVSNILDDTRVRFVEQDRYMKTKQVVQTAGSWGLDRIDQRDLPMNARYAYLRTGRGVNAYIIDSGLLSTHSEFTGRVGPGFSVIRDGRGTGDCDGHGTHVAGTVGGTTWGVAKEVTIHPVRVVDCTGFGSASGVLAGIDWLLANHRKPAVAMLGLNGRVVSTAIDEAVQRSIAAGITFVVPAGNESTNACTASPSRLPQAIVVGASTISDTRATYSNFGTCLDLFAPGDGIVSAWHTRDDATNAISGTSMAAAHVAGAAALLLEESPTAPPGQIERTLLDFATPNRIAGAGLGSANRLVFTLTTGAIPPADPQPIAGFARPRCNGFQCRFDASTSTDNAPIARYIWDFGDGTQGEGAVVDKTYASDGTFVVTLTVVDTVRQSASVQVRVTIRGPGAGAPCGSCTRFQGPVDAATRVGIPPNQPFTVDATGEIRGWLKAPQDADYALLLFQKTGSSSARVAEGRTVEIAGERYKEVIYTARPGTYHWIVYATTGEGQYLFWSALP